MFDEFKELLSIFNARGVRYVVVGGYAVSLHAQPRSTQHIDILVAADGRFGTLGRGTFRAPGFRDFDLALIKDTAFGHRGNGELAILEIRAEFFNIFNEVNFGLPSNIVRGSGFGSSSAAPA